MGGGVIGVDGGGGGFNWSGLLKNFSKLLFMF